MKGWASSTQGAGEFLGRHFGLTKHTCKGTYLDLGVHWYDATFGLAPQDDMAPALPHLDEPKAFQSANYLGPKNSG